MTSVPKQNTFKRIVVLCKIPVLGAIVTSLLTYFSYRSLSNNIHANETLVTNYMRDRIGVEFEWRYNQQSTATVMGFLNSNVSRQEYHLLSQPSLDEAPGSTSLGWFPKVYPEDRSSFVEKANVFYEDLGIEYDITYSPDLGEVDTRPVNDQHMFPLLFSNPTSLTYIGYDFYIPSSINRSDSLLDLAMSLKQPVSTDKIILSLFGGPSEFVDEELNPVSNVEEPVYFMIFHSVHDEDDNSFGVVGNAFQPRGFILNVISSFGKVVEDMNVYVFRKTNYVYNEYELLFDLNTFEEANPVSKLTLDNVKSNGKRSYTSILNSDVGNDVSGRLQIIVVLTSNTSPDPYVYLMVFTICIVSSFLLWYTYTSVERTSEINKKLSDSKSKFISEMSHELRTPLNGIMGMTDIIVDEDLSPGGRECLDDLNTCGTILLSIISEVLDLSKIEAGKVQTSIRQENIRKFVTKTLRIMTFYRSLNEKENNLKLYLHIDEEVPHLMISDFSKIGKILMNFIGNSIKFTESGSITVIISCEKQFLGNKKRKSFLNVHEGEELRYLKIVIRDTGKGMSPESMENLFRPFSQVQLGKSSDGGTGLGLVICKTFAEIMGGGVKCESEKNIGTTFTTWVQAKYFPHSSPYLHGNFQNDWTIKGSSKEKIEAVSQERPSVLVVDDVCINLRVIGKLLNSMGISFETASSGENSIQKCSNTKYDVILMDYCMNGINGIEASVEIKKGINFGAKIIILTANDYSEEIRDAGFGYLQKPINRESLNILRK